MVGFSSGARIGICAVLLQGLVGCEADWRRLDPDGDTYYYGSKVSAAKQALGLNYGDCWEGSESPKGSVLKPEDFYPGAEDDIDGYDQSCDGVDGIDGDGDGYASNQTTDPDCDDEDETVHPGAADQAGDGVDQDCDGQDAGTPDADGDGYASDDCDDTDASIHPGAAEVCDEVDQDCDDLIDEDVTTAYYPDLDGDGYGSGDAVAACTAPEGHVENADDCDDANAGVNPDAVEVCDDDDNDCDGELNEGFVYSYADEDSDGYGGEVICEDSTGITTGGDCDDHDPDIHPGVVEVCDDVDQNCDGAVDTDIAPTWYQDADEDTYGNDTVSLVQCAEPDGYVLTGGDCADTDPSVNPGAAEGINDGIDQDCDGSESCYLDEDGDGYAGDNVSEVSADLDCDDDGEGVESTDCDDADGTVNPDADEGAADGIDQDCDGWESCYDDGDGDGYGGSGVSETSSDLDCEDSGEAPDSSDCDDTHADIFPDAPEYCDDADNDCDGDIDDDAKDKVTWYKDADADGFGIPEKTKDACSEPSGYSAYDTDCDDADADINPDADEICDLADTDENCNGKADDKDASVISSGKSTYYPDGDVDGYGDGTDPTLRCDMATGFVVDGTDCDDTDSAVYPTAPEVCDDGVLQDCDARTSGDAVAALGECGPESGDLADAPTQVRGVSASGGLGGAVALVGDYTGDAVSDIAIGAAGVSSGAGKVYLLEGPLDTGSSTVSSRGTYIAPSATAVDALGSALSGCDGDGDGYADLVIGAPEYGSTGANGRAYLMRGPGTGLLTSAALTLAGPGTSDKAGTSLSCGGDADSDGLPDLAVGTPGGSSTAGRVYVILGDLGDTTSDLDDVDQAYVYGDTSGDALGTSVTYGLDYDADGVGDLWVGVPGDDAGTGSDGGAGFLIRGPFSGAINEAVVDLAAYGASNEAAGTSVASAGDTDGDGYDDLLIGAPSYDSGATDRGRAYLVLGASSWASPIALSAADAIYTGAAAGDAAGTAVGSVGDVDADGNADLVIGAPGEDSGGSGAGAAYLIYGPGSGSLTLSGADAIFTGETSGDAAGTWVGGLGDQDGDGGDEIAIGAPGWDSTTSGVGNTYLLGAEY